MKRTNSIKTFACLVVLAILLIPKLSQAQFTLQLLHASDLEGGVDAIDRAPNFAAIIDGIEEDYPNTIILSSGDNYIPGPFFSASADATMRPVLQSFYDAYYGGITSNNLREGVGRVDISIMNAIGFDASVLGNHEFDAGTSTIGELIGEGFSGSEVRWVGNQFPYLSSNLDFSNDGALSGMFTSSIEMNTFFQSNPNTMLPGEKKSIAPATLIERGGELIGVVGATTPLLESISSPGETQVMNPGAGTNNMTELASILQPVINDLIAAGANKIILVSHLQQLSREEELVGLLSGIDIVVAGGSDALLANEGDDLNPGDENHIYGAYPLQSVNADGEPALIVNTDGEYSYVGRLVVTFDENGVLMPETISSESGPYVSSDEKVAEIWGSLESAFADGTKGSQVKSLTDAVQDIVIAKDGNIFGSTNVYLEGRRNSVRSEETNLGNFTADANLWFARQIDETTAVSIKNGGGIRAAIGEAVAFSSDNVLFLPPQASELSGKQEGELSQLDIENSMRFNNELSLVSVSAEGLLTVLEYGVSNWEPGATPGSFAQVGGVRFSFDPSLPANSRIRNAVVLDADGNDSEVLVQDGVLIGDPNREFRVVTLNFLAGGGDGYPFDAVSFDRLDLVGNVPTEVSDAGVADFAAAGTEQDAFAEYAAAKFSNEPFNIPETSVELDGRIQNLSFRSDAIFLDPAEVEFSEEFVNVPEGSGIITIEVEVNNPRSEHVSVQLIASAASTASEGSQFSLGNPIMAGPGESTLEFQIEILDDTDKGGKFIALQISPNEGVIPGNDDTFVVLIRDNDTEPVLPSVDPSLQMTVINSLTTPEDAVAEISAYDKTSQRLFVTNSEDNQLFIFDLSDLTVSYIINTVEIDVYGGGITSVDVYNGIVAVAVEGEESFTPGKVVFLDIDGNFLNSVQVGTLPDMVVFTHDGSKVLTANEGEPNADYDIDPVGSISIIDISGGIESLSNANVSNAGFESFNDQAEALKATGVRISGLNASVAQDIEPEYITISADNLTAYVTLQENNAIAVVNISAATVTAIYPLGSKDLSLIENQLDISDRSDDIFFASWNNMKALHMPDAIASFTIEGVEYLITANEGDSRDYDGFVDEDRIKDLDLDPAAFPFADILQRDELMGRLTVMNTEGDYNDDGEIEEIFVYGGRSFSIWNAQTGDEVYDSGSDIENAIANDPIWGSVFNSNEDELEMLNRSDNKGPEPEGVTTGVINGRTYAFVLLERMGGVMAWDVTNPNAPVFVQYLNNRDTEDGEIGDLAPEGVIFVPATDSPNGKNLLLVSNEVSGTVTIIQLDGMDEPVACDSYQYYLSDVDADGITTIYQAELSTEDETATLTALKTVDYEAHIAFNSEDGLLYLVRSEGGSFQTLDVSYLDGELSEETSLSNPLPKVTTAVINADGKLLLGDSDMDIILSVNILNGQTSPYASADVSGGDMTFGLDGKPYLASRHGSILYQLFPGEMIQMIGNVPNAVTGLATLENGKLLVSAQNSGSLVVRDENGADTGESFEMILNGAPFMSFDGDLASGCGDNIPGPSQSFEDGGNCYATEVINYTQGTSLNGGSIAANRTNSEKALGAPERTDEMVFVSLGYGGSITFAFDGSVPNQEGSDIEVVETTFNNSTCDSYSEYAMVSVSQNGIQFYPVKTICRADGMVDISDAQGTPALDFVNYVRISNDDELSNTPDAFDVDGVVALVNCENITIEPLVQSAGEGSTMLSTYPNPTAGLSEVVFQTSTEGNAILEVYDVNGKNIATLFNQFASNDQEYRVNFNGLSLPNGVYVYRLTTENETMIEKFMIAK